MTDMTTGEVLPDTGVELIETSPTMGALFAALAAAQGTIRNAARDSSNPFFRSTYADLASTWEACRNSLAAHGIAVVQVPAMHAGKPALVTILGHESGEWIRGCYPIRPMRQVKDAGWEDSKDPQSIGSAFTYARRYSLAAMVGVAAGDDDDGEAAVGRASPPRTPSAAPRPPADEAAQIAAIHACTTLAALDALATSAAAVASFDALPAAGKARVKAAGKKLRAALAPPENEDAEPPADVVLPILTGGAT